MDILLFDILFFAWYRKNKQNFWLFFLFVSVKTVGNDTVMMMILAGNANSLILLLGMRKREKMNEK